MLTNRDNCPAPHSDAHRLRSGGLVILAAAPEGLVCDRCYVPQRRRQHLGSELSGSQRTTGGAVLRSLPIGCGSFATPTEPRPISHERVALRQHGAAAIGLLDLVADLVREC